jgi:hypothetical protein
LRGGKSLIVRNQASTIGAGVLSSLRAPDFLPRHGCRMQTPSVYGDWWFDAIGSSFTEPMSIWRGRKDLGFATISPRSDQLNSIMLFRIAFRD